ncbi:MAG TPA: F0F1 ATP synthase subunit delta [Candidatus Saccharimonadales bacterium]|jgi:F0F1-type ATP synthase delta subunit
MKISRHTIAAALAVRAMDAQAGSEDARRFAHEIAAYLLQQRRTGELDSLLRDIMQYRADNGIVEVVAASAYPLSDQVRSDIESQVRAQYPEAKQITISPRHDPSVVAGVRLEFANQQLDLSIRNKLNRLKQLTAHA